MKGEKLLDAMGQISEQYIEEAAPQNRKKKHPVARSLAALAAAAAVFAIAVLGSTLLGRGNAFTISAFAMEAQAENEVKLHALDLVDQPDVWSGYATDHMLFINVGLQCEGKNLESVIFSVADGALATLNVDPERLQKSEASPLFYIDSEQQTPLSYLDFQTVGNTLQLNADALSGNLLVFWGKEMSGLKSLPNKVDILATATFKNQETKQQTITLDLSGEGIYSLLNLAQEKIYSVHGDTPVIDASDRSEIEQAFQAAIRADGTLQEVRVQKLEPYEETLQQDVWFVTFDVLPTPESRAIWMAGNGEEGEDGWIINKGLYLEVTRQNGKIDVEILGTGL